MTNNTIRVAEAQRDYADERRTEPCTRCWRWGKSRGDVLVYTIGETVGWEMKPCPDCGGTGVVSYGEARR